MSAGISRTVELLIDSYLWVGVAYGIGRSFYYIPKVQDYTITKDGVKHHPITFGGIIAVGTIQVASSPIGWPLYMIKDIGVAQLKKQNIVSLQHPFPYDAFEWKKQEQK